MTLVLEVENLNFSIAGTPILDNVSFSLEANDFMSIIGPNGGGKSTLLKLLLGLESPDSGSIRLFGQPPMIGRKKVGYLPQKTDHDLGFPITVKECVALAVLRQSWLRFLSAPDYDCALMWLDRVGAAHLADRQMTGLSGGERQRVLLARALMADPQLLIFDEPTTAIDAQGEQQFYSLLQSLNQSMAILMVSHDISAVSAVSKKLACLNRRFYYHGESSLSPDDIADAYSCPVELVAHGHPHRVVNHHHHAH